MSTCCSHCSTPTMSIMGGPTLSSTRRSRMGGPHVRSPRTGLSGSSRNRDIPAQSRPALPLSAWDKPAPMSIIPSGPAAFLCSTRRSSMPVTYTATGTSPTPTCWPSPYGTKAGSSPSTVQCPSTPWQAQLQATSSSCRRRRPQGSNLGAPDAPAREEGGRWVASTLRSDRSRTRSPPLGTSP